ncbi:MAG: hypothetical protein FJW23_07725 [Acidimicrobiia bacterium]|nr:hypothetical protein [Acidimicrobiia bacterium]
MFFRQTSVSRYVALTAAFAVLAVARPVAQSAPGAALGGAVSSAAEGKMEGVLVSARRDGANHTVTVVSDAQGRYTFPRTHLSPGRHTVTIRATGFDLAGPAAVEVPAQGTATLDLALQPAKDLIAQLTSLELTMAMPGTEQMKNRFTYQGASCNYCHSLHRVIQSRHAEPQWKRVINRMSSYYPDGSAHSNDNRAWGRRLMDYGDSFGRPTPNGPDEGRDPDRWFGMPIADLAPFLSSINLSGGRTTLAYEPKPTLARPTGRATRVIITQWDQPRVQTVSHDMDVDSKGNVWYGDESNQVIGKLDPRAHTFTEYELPPVPDGHLPGTRDVEVDKHDHVWFPMRIAGGASLLTKFEPATEKVTTVADATGQFIAEGPNDTMWMGGAVNPFHKIDMKTMTKVATYPGNGYQVVVSSKGNPYIAGFGGVEGYDVAADKPIRVPYMTKTTWGRRGRMDPQDRYWFAMYASDRIGMYDTNTGELKEWPLRQYFTPYTVTAPDKAGMVWAPSNTSDRLARLDPKTGEIIEYLMPTELDTKKIAFDPTSDRVTLLFANMRTARIARVEVLD